MLNWKQEAGQRLAAVRQTQPLVQAITNFVTVNDCANIILAAGGTPTMASHPQEVCEICAISQALVLNLGTVDDFEAMLLAAEQAERCHVPVIFDPVGAGSSKLRSEYCARLIDTRQLSVIRGNISEIKSLAHEAADTRGVDAGAKDLVTEQNLSQTIEMARRLSAKTGAIIAISGALDVIADAAHAVVVKNGCPEMARITGSGCMLTAMLGAFCGANPNHQFAAVVAAFGTMGIAGECALARILERREGNASFRTHLIDAVYTMTPEQLNEGLRIENF